MSEPIAAIADRYLPESAKKGLDVGLEPVSVLVGVWRIITYCKTREEATIKAFARAMAGRGGDQQEAGEGDDAPVVDAARSAEEAQSMDAIGRAV